MPRRARYLVPRGTPRRGEFLAACAVVVVLSHLVFAQLTLVVAIALYWAGKATRWHPSWLAMPAAAGILWTLAVGPRAAAAGFVAGPAQVIGYLNTSDHQVGHLLHFGAAFAGARSWLPKQLPIAMLTGAAEAGLATWLSWLHTDEWDMPEPRPGLLVTVRRLALVRAIRAGGIVTRDGASLGITPGSGTRVSLSWREAAGGVLVCGSTAAQPLTTSFQLVQAALRRRKPVLAVDLTGDPDLPGYLAAACGGAGVPLHVFGGAAAVGPGQFNTAAAVRGGHPACYEPFRYGPPAHRAALVTGMLSWDGQASQHRRSCAAYLEDVFELLDAAPGDPRVPVLDEVLHLLSPAALRARVQHVPASYARRSVLVERVQVSASLTDAEPAAIASLAQELRALRGSQAGRWLRQPVGGQLAPVDLGRTVTSRSVALFCLNGSARDMLTRLVCQDLLGLGARLRGMGVDADAVVWLAGCDAIPEQTLRELIAAGPAAGLSVVATTSSPKAAGDLAEHPNALLVHRIADPAAAGRLAAAAAMSADDLATLGDEELVLAVARPRRLVPRVLAVRSRIDAR
ncbi:MAG: hypothetical protein JO345_37335 [Streptosporangiaceae bacterium]|nr:hypothetical protein [Streptosporangiaceae bacterium]